MAQVIKWTGNILSALVFLPSLILSNSREAGWTGKCGIEY